MDKKSAFSSIFQDTLIGLLIGWGGFSALLPDLMGAIGEITNLGSYKALRAFSIVYFLSPVFVFLIYWWVRGFKRYFYVISGALPLPINYFNTWLVVSIAYKLAPIIYFFDNQFFIYEHTVFSYATIILVYVLGASLELYFLTKNVAEKQNTLLSVLPKIALFKANTIVLSLNVLFGIGVAVFIEPWCIYDSKFIYILVGAFALYLLFCAAYYIHLIPKKGRSVNEYKQWGSGLLIISLLATCFPALNYVKWAGAILITMTCLLLILWGIFSNVRDDKPWHLHNAVWVGFIVMAMVCLSIVDKVVDKIYLQANQLYFTNRVITSNNISDKKIFPFLAYDSANFVQSDSLRLHTIKQVYDSNHAWIYRGKTDSMFWKDQNFLIGGKPAESIQKSYNMRNMFYNKYVIYANTFKHELNHDLGELRRHVNSKFKDHGSLNNFYGDLYKYIHLDLVSKYLAMVDIETLPDSLPNVRDYFHPINYYTETLKYYKKRTTNTRKLQGHIKEWKFLDTLKTGYQGYDSSLSTTVLSLENKKTRIAKDKILPLLEEFPELRSIAKKEFTDYFIQYLDFFKTYTDLQYLERYNKAQIVFRSYLIDSQRVGIYIFIYMMVIIGLLYWYYSELPNAYKNSSDSPYDTPQHFLKISFLVVAVMFIHISFPIKPENINPEKPYWMMDLKSWKNRNALQEFISTRSSRPRPSSDDNNEQMFQLMNQVESNLKTLINVNKSNNLFNSEIYSSMDSVKSP